MCVQNLKSVALPDPKIIGGTQKLGRSLAMPTLSIPSKNHAYHTDYSSMCFRFRAFSIAVLSGGCKPPILGKGRPYGVRDGAVQKSVGSSYRSSIVTFPLYLRVSGILPLLFSNTPLFPCPTSSLLKIFPCSPGSRWIAFTLQRAKVLG